LRQQGVQGATSTKPSYPKLKVAESPFRRRSKGADTEA
jgi:hypothetical protein